MITIEKEKCCGCSACYNICPTHSIEMKADEEGFLYPVIDEKSCIKCGLCHKVCSFKTKASERLSVPKTIAAKALNSTIREKSSSGGIFSVLAEAVLDNKGIVYGVSLSNDLKKAMHIRATNKAEYEKLRGSKYLQAEVGDVFQHVKDDLISGKEVLFSGVPCQIDGLKQFLGKEFAGLLTVEVVCHGVPSPKLWQKYLLDIEEQYNANVIGVNFREKRNASRDFGLEEDENRIYYFVSQKQNPYMRMFLRNLCLRPSCYSCNAKTHESSADLTLADFWGIERILPDMDDTKGTSLVFIHSEKGTNAINSVNKSLLYREVDFKTVIEENSSYYLSSVKPEARNNFFNDLSNKDFSYLTNKYVLSTQKGVRFKCVRLMRKIESVIKGEKTAKKIKFEYGLMIEMEKKNNPKY